MKPFKNLQECREACQAFGFSPEITAETCWNEGYRLGRSRWYWGPAWMVTVRGWINTQIYKIRSAVQGKPQAFPTSEGNEV